MIEMQQTDKKLLRRYLLGEAAAEEQSTIEQRLLTDQDCFNELLKVEEELIDEYVGGELEDPEKKDFELHFVTNPERRDSVEFARTLNRYLCTHTANADEKSGQREQARYAWLHLLTPQWRAAAGGVACMVLLLAAASALLWRQTLDLQHQVQQVEFQRSQSEQHEQELMRQVEQQLAQNGMLTVEFERQKDELIKLRRELAWHLSFGRPPQVDATVASLILAPGLSRALGQAGTAILSPSTQKLRLNLEIGGASYRRYRAEVQTVEGTVVSTQSDLKPHETGHNRTVTIVLPAVAMTRSDYLVMLDGISENGASEKIGTYYFKVVRK